MSIAYSFPKHLYISSPLINDLFSILLLSILRFLKSIAQIAFIAFFTVDSLIDKASAIYECFIVVPIFPNKKIKTLKIVSQAILSFFAGL